MRLFAALEIPGDVRSAMSAWAARAVGRDPAVRLVSTDALHLTLVFLGSQDEEDADEIGSVVCDAARRLPSLAISDAAWLPARRPGVLVADVVEDHEDLGDLQSDLAEGLSAWHEPETRAFRPHITVARVRRGQKIALREVPAPPRLIFDPTAIVLYRSHTGPQGARYEALASAPLR